MPCQPVRLAYNSLLALPSAKCLGSLLLQLPAVDAFGRGPDAVAAAASATLAALVDVAAFPIGSAAIVSNGVLFSSKWRSDSKSLGQQH